MKVDKGYIIIFATFAAIISAFAIGYQIMSELHEPQYYSCDFTYNREPPWPSYIAAGFVTATAVGILYWTWKHVSEEIERRC